MTLELTDLTGYPTSLPFAVPEGRSVALRAPDAPPRKVFQRAANAVGGVLGAMQAIVNGGVERALEAGNIRFDDGNQ